MEQEAGISSYEEPAFFYAFAAKANNAVLLLFALAYFIAVIFPYRFFKLFAFHIRISKPTS